MIDNSADHTTVVRFEETGANTGVFTSQDSNDKSNIKAVGSENDDFTIEYADGDVQVFIESFDSTLEADSRRHVELWQYDHRETDRREP